MSTLNAPGITAELDSGLALAIPIEVNKHEFVVHERHMNGAEIKAAAISAGVHIQPNFTLMQKHVGRPSDGAPV